MADGIELFGLHEEKVPEFYKTLSFDNLIELVSVELDSPDGAAPPPVVPSTAAPLHDVPVVQAAGMPSISELLSRTKPLPLLQTETHSAPSPVPKVKADFYPCFVDIVSSSTELKDNLDTDILQIFGVPLMYCISDGNIASTQAVSDGLMPKYVIQLRLNTQLPGTPDRSEKLMNRLTTANWEKVNRAVHKLTNTQLFVNKHCPSVGFGVELTSLNSSVRVLVTLNDEKKMAATVEFYKQLVHHSHVTAEKAIYPLSSLCEFEVRCDKDVTLADATGAASLCFLLKSNDVAGCLSPPSTTGWHSGTDPDGNEIHVKYINSE